MPLYTHLFACPSLGIPTQVLLEPSEGLMGSVVEARIKTATRWSVTGEVVAFVHKAENLSAVSAAMTSVATSAAATTERPSGRDSAAIRHGFSPSGAAAAAVQAGCGEGQTTGSGERGRAVSAELGALRDLAADGADVFEGFVEVGHLRFTLQCKVKEARAEVKGIFGGKVCLRG